MLFKKEHLILMFVVIAAFLSALATETKFFKKNKNKQTAANVQKTNLTNNKAEKKSKFSFNILTQPAASPSPLLSPSPSPLSSPSSSFLASSSPLPMPTPSIFPSPLKIPVENIFPPSDSEITDFPYFLNFSDSSFGLSFKYHPEWVSADNSDLSKLHFIDKNKVSLLKSKIFYAFEDPDYQLGKYEIMQINAFNPQAKDLLNWLLSVNNNALNNKNKLVYQQINNQKFLRIKDKENQVYFVGPSGKVYSFWFKCADYSGCDSTNEEEKLFRKILSTIN